MRSSDINVYVLIDLEKLGRSPDTPEVYGSIKQLAESNIEDKGVVLTYTALWNRLSKNSNIKFWKNNRYIIKKCKVKRPSNTIKK